MITWGEAMQEAVEAARRSDSSINWVNVARELREAQEPREGMHEVTSRPGAPRELLGPDGALYREVITGGEVVADERAAAAEAAYLAQPRDTSGDVVPLHRVPDDGDTTVIRTDPSRAPRLRAAGDVATQVIDTTGIWSCRYCPRSIAYDPKIATWRHMLSGNRLCDPKDTSEAGRRRFAWPAEKQGSEWAGGE